MSAEITAGSLALSVIIYLGPLDKQILRLELNVFVLYMHIKRPRELLQFL